MLLTLFSAVFLILLFCYPSLCTLGAAKGLALWYEQVLPALFPAMTAVSFLYSRTKIQLLLKRLPFPAAICFLSGFLCGSPMGALTCSGLYQSKLLTKKEASLLVCVIQLPSPLFLSSFVASTTLKLPSSMSALFLLSAYLPFFLSFVAYLLLFLIKKRTDYSLQATTISSFKLSKTETSEPSLTDVCNTCLLLLVRIGILLMFFSILSELISHFFPDQVLLIGLFEMTTGISKVSSLSLPIATKSALCLFLLNFGGFCVHIQVRQAWQQADFPTLRYLLIRLFFGIVSSLFFLLLV